MPDRPFSVLRSLSMPFSGQSQLEVPAGQPGTVASGAILPLAPFLSLARDLAAMIVPVRPRAEFRAELQRNLMVAARQQIARDLLLDPVSVAGSEGGERRWVWGAATFGSAVSLAGIVAYVWFHRRRQAA